jgi:uncharacterized repeat protein (TIGR03803 family)
MQRRSQSSLGWSHQNLIPGIRRRAATAALAWAVVLVPGVVATPSAQAQAFEILYTFTGTFTGGADGWGPNGLIRDAAGNLYGTTQYGGNSSCFGGCGTVFKLDTAGTETVLYTFTGGTDGANPVASLIRDSAGNLYGTTYGGGASNLGTVFKLDTTGTETVLHSFTGAPDGANPTAALVRDAAGNLYGTTFAGGLASGTGTVFKLDATGTETVLHTFSGYPTDGARPTAALIRDAAGNLYGTTSVGGASKFDGGTVFKLDTSGTETVLYSFCCIGSGPTAGLLRDAAGNLYGTNPGLNQFYGSVFKLDITGTVTGLHNFTGSDGAHPTAGLVRDGAGNLYGTASGAGCRYGLCGTVFRLKPL